MCKAYVMLFAYSINIAVEKSVLIKVQGHCVLMQKQRQIMCETSEMTQ